MPGADLRIGELTLRLSGIDRTKARGLAERTGQILRDRLAVAGLSGRIDRLDVRVDREEARDPARLAAAILRAAAERAR